MNSSFLERDHLKVSARLSVHIIRYIEFESEDNHLGKITSVTRN